MPVVRIAQAQINTTVGDFASNRKKIIELIKKAESQWVHVVTFPELSVCGYPPEDLLLKRDFLEDNLEAVDEIRQHIGKTAAVVGYAHWHQGSVYNSAALLHDRELISTYHKIELPNYGVFDEKRYFAPGSQCPVFEMEGVRFILSICEDIWIQGNISEQSALASAVDIILNISASPFHAGKLDIRVAVAERLAQNTHAFICFNNLVGGQDELVFDGGSFVMKPEGTIFSRARRFREELLITDIPVEPEQEIPVEPEQETPEQGVATEPGKDVVLLKPYFSHQGEDLMSSMADEYGRLDEVYEALVLGTRDYVRKNGFKGVLIGLSGGIDSSITAVIAVDALGSQNVLCVTMPSPYTSSGTLFDAEKLAENLNVRLIRVPLDPIYASYLEAVKDVFGRGDNSVAHENIQARIRGNILMALSNQYGWLVLTTGNKSEIAVGYCTLYGDMAGGFAVIKDVPKTLVFELSEYVNRSRGREMIPRSVIDRPPSAELRPDQKDEDSLPPYHILDGILHAYVEEDKGPDEIIRSGFDSRTVHEVVRMVDLNEYKRRQAPPGVKITPKAFGRDRRLPITNVYLKNPR